MMKTKTAKYAAAVIGLLLAAAGLVLIKTNSDPQGILRALPYVCVGVGCGLFGHGMGSIISKRAVQRDPEAQRKLKIEANDERNIAIESRAKGKAFDMMTFIFGALMISFALMGVDTAALLLLVFAYLCVHGFAIYYRVKFEKEM